MSGLGLLRLQHLVLWVANVERSVRFYCDVLGFEVKRRYPNAAFLKIPGTPDDHHLGLFEQTGVVEGKIQGKLKPTGIRPKFVEKFEVQGINLPPGLFGFSY